MAQNATSPKHTPDQWRLDLDALLPTPAGIISVGGQDHDCWHFLDVDTAPSIEVIELARRLETPGETTYAQQLEDAKRILAILCPSLDQGQKKLRPKQLIWAAARAISTSQAKAAVTDPPNADEAPTSLSNSPSSAVSTGGPTTT